MATDNRIRNVFLAIMLCSLLFTSIEVQASPSDELNGRLDQYVQEQWKSSNIPGLAVVVVEDSNILYETYLGYSDLDRKAPVTNTTVFELGSNSKAFTGLAILNLEQQGYLSLEDPVNKYLPWFYMTYQGKPFQITLRQLLYHTSGIHPETIHDIPISTDDDALETTVRMLVGKELTGYKTYRPGEYFLYATINYDILGLIVQEISGMSFEAYMQNHIIGNLDLDHTYMTDEDAVQNGLAKGYKLGFFSPHEYNAPRFRGNTPAGYIHSAPADIAKWMQIQLGAIKPSGMNPSLIELSHNKDNSVAPSGDGSSYAAGWSIYQSGSGEIAHGGSNPNFSSFIMMRKDGNVGVAVMGNMNSDYPEVIAHGIMSIIREQVPSKPLPDTYSRLDKLASIIILVFSAVFLCILGLLGKLFVEIKKKKRHWAGFNRALCTRIFISLSFLLIYLLGLYYIPEVLLGDLSWNALQIWAPFTLIPAIFLAGAFGIVYFFYYVFSQLFANKMEKPYVTILLLGIVSGLGNAFIIYVINQSFGREDNLTNGLFFYFGLGILMYVCGQRYISSQLVILTNNLVYDKRMELIGKILKTPYEKLERMEDGRLHAVLNNDTEKVSGSVNMIVTGLISCVTLLCCFIYLGMLNGYALLLSITVIFVIAFVYFLFGDRAEKRWEETRDIQTHYFHLINDMLRGFKELRLNKNKNRDFEAHLESCSNEYRLKRTEGDVRFANVNVVGELLFTLVIGSVAFIFPYIFPHLQTSTVQAYVFIFLYMTGPVNSILNTYPVFLQVRISWRRIEELSGEITELQNVDDPFNKPLSEPEMAELAVHDVQYQYCRDGQGLFSVGPFRLTFRRGTITFITGGNGSGKTTLGKLITGLYTPASGFITIDNQPVDSEQLGGYFSAIFNDFYLFKRLYGIDCSDKQGKINELLNRLQLSDKVTIQDDRLSTTTDLSTGQKKRLALLLTYLEDKPICLFDEWAADQDPEYRHYFYHVILPEMKKEGKCIIAITHDDRFFHLADELIKLEQGKMHEAKPLLT